MFLMGYWRLMRGLMYGYGEGLGEKGSEAEWKPWQNFVKPDCREKANNQNEKSRTTQQKAQTSQENKIHK